MRIGSAPSARRTSRRGLVVALPAAMLLAMMFVGTALGHHTLPSAKFACDGTVTWHVDSWTTDNANNQALASDVEVSYSLDGGSYTKIGDFHFDADNYLAGIGGTFDAGGTATAVTIRANLKAGTTWGDGDDGSLGPWDSGSVPRSDEDCAKPTPSPTPTPTPTPGVNQQCTEGTCPTATPPGGGVLAATGKPKVTPPSTSTAMGEATSSGDGWRIVLLGLAVLLASILILTPSDRRRRIRNR